MAWISPLKADMSISNQILEGNPSNLLVSLAQKIAIYTVIPIVLVMTFEAVVLNFLFVNLANGAIAGLNKVHEIWNRTHGPDLTRPSV